MWHVNPEYFERLQNNIAYSQSEYDSKRGKWSYKTPKRPKSTISLNLSSGVWTPHVKKSLKVLHPWIQAQFFWYNRVAGISKQNLQVHASLFKFDLQAFNIARWCLLKAEVAHQPTDCKWISKSWWDLGTGLQFRRCGTQKLSPLPLANTPHGEAINLWPTRGQSACVEDFRPNLWAAAAIEGHQSVS